MDLKTAQPPPHLTAKTAQTQRRLRRHPLNRSQARRQMRFPHPHLRAHTCSSLVWFVHPKYV